MNGNSHEDIDALDDGVGSDGSLDGRAPGSSSEADRWLAAQLLVVVGRPNVDFELWDGHVVTAPGRERRADLRVRLEDRGALYRLLYKPTRTFGDLYTAGRLTVPGDLVTTLERVYAAMALAGRDSGPSVRLARRLVAKRARRNTLEGARENIHSHYDLGNEFYELWLDGDYTQYTCAYYPVATATLEQAQAAKLELVCRKLRLQPGETVIEAGSGWGGLARYLVRHYGVEVRSYNISAEQVAYARERARREGLDEHIEYVEDDYRNAEGSCDAFVSVGMLEHVGVDNYPVLGRTIDRVLKDDGRGLIHSIGQDVSWPLNEWIESYIFPGAQPPTLREMMQIFEPVSLSVVDVENLRPHYAQTLRHWLERFETNEQRVEEMFDREFVRAWRLYLSGSVAAFTEGQLQLFQVLFRRPLCRTLPQTRDHMRVGPGDLNGPQIRETGH
ncbi:MAG: cyclopropane-fatty-acyl-phospholipid synthase family protein [Pseudomonadales bacterium]